MYTRCDGESALHPKYVLQVRVRKSASPQIWASIVYWVWPYNFANKGLSHEILMMDCGVECGCCVRMGFSFVIVMQLIRQISL